MIQDLFRKYLAGAVVDLRDGNTGGLRTRPTAMLFLLPIVIGVGGWFTHVTDIAPAALLPGAAITTGALLGLLSLTFNRVKDAAASPRPIVGIDPAYQAGVLFSSILYSAQVALTLSGLLLVLLLVDSEVGLRIGVAVALALFAHLGVRIALVLQSLKLQARQMLGSRSTPPDAQLSWQDLRR
ncbi:hypothetical protein G8767_25495 [Rhodococcus sp. IC4_135]|uniref:hypothetical protein n=1 Tax=Rhodococcus TaxID=1827 RepID=UPI00141F5618|nr:hypothetical protein [Rhodococcus sp. IC4_135]